LVFIKHREKQRWNAVWKTADHNALNGVKQKKKGKEKRKKKQRKIKGDVIFFKKGF